MRRIKEGKSVTFRSYDERDNSRLVVRYTNKGDPYSEGIEFALYEEEYDQGETVFLEVREVIELRDYLNSIIIE